ncbi:DUF952 domain-containing protein [Novosphingobium huizhouense]|uniref:DUF952 domain-containing protein n=1 Tax=Novosphingobium huizhouense TaxID=2866625 RepID=UPI001CD8B211|nr:DUF952 domain-containing protein [Novosphingobium huizhouense]
MSEMPQVAYKILTAPQMAELEAQAVFRGAPVDLADGFIHLSTEAQLAETVDKHFAGAEDLHIATVDLAVLGDAVKWEPSRGGQLFPHVYADLPLSAVLAYAPLRRDESGAIVLPVAS